MPRRHADLPRLWLMTDPRQGDALWEALRRLPRGAGVVFRHHGVPDRHRLYERVRRIARARRLMLVLAGGVSEAVAWRADGVHIRTSRRIPRGLIWTAPVHNRREADAARGADLLFVSPVYPTRSHPRGRTLGRIGLHMLARGRLDRVVALGGMDASRAAPLGVMGIRRWAAIDALTPPIDPNRRQKRNAVPT